MTNIWFRLNQWAKIAQLTWWQKSVASTSLEESEKKVHELQCKKTNRQQAGESQHCALRYLQSHRPQKCKFPRRLRWSRRRRRLSLAISKGNYETPALRKSKYWLFTSMAASKENKLPPSFSGFKSQKLLHESGGSSLAVRSVLLFSKQQYSSCKRRTHLNYENAQTKGTNKTKGTNEQGTGDCCYGQDRLNDKMDTC